MKVKKFLLMFVLSFSLIACSQNLGVPVDAIVAPTFTPWVAGTQTAMVVSAEETQSAQSALTQDVLPTIAFPSSTSVVMEKPTDFSPVLYGGKLYDTTFFLLLGGVSKDAWLMPDDSVARFSGEVTYSLNSMTQESKYFLWGKAPELSLTCYTIGTDAALDEGGFVGVVDGWAVTKRDVTELSADVELYQQAVIDWLTDKGVDAPQLGTLQIFRVDIEGDGSDEIFISATHLDDSQHTTKTGDYSIVLMRKAIGNDVVTKLLVGDVYSSKELELTYPRTYSLANFIDLNQDGVLEVVVGFQKWEGFGASVFQIDGQDVTQALGAGC